MVEFLRKLLLLQIEARKFCHNVAFFVEKFDAAIPGLAHRHGFLEGNKQGSFAVDVITHLASGDNVFELYAAGSLVVEHNIAVNNVAAGVAMHLHLVGVDDDAQFLRKSRFALNVGYNPWPSNGIVVFANQSKQIVRTFIHKVKMLHTVNFFDSETMNFG